MDDPFFWCMFAGVIVCTSAMNIYTARSNQILLVSWLRKNGYSLLRKRYVHFWRGPFFWSSCYQRVYRVAVEDEQGNQKSGLVRLTNYGGAWGTEPVEVIWDNPKK